LGNGTGSTGTLRIDDVRITVQAAQDLSLDRLAFIPSLPAFGDSVYVAATIHNRGTQVASSYSIEYYVDMDNDSLPDPVELISAIQSPSPLAAGDSALLDASLGTFPAGSHLIMGKLVYPPDQQLFDNQQYATLLVGYPPQSVVVNEIMYAPTGTEPEWVELYSLSQDTVDLQGWLVSDNIVSSKKLITPFHFYLAPELFCVLTRDSAALKDNHPEIVAPILQVSGFPTLNNSGDAVVVYDLRGTSIDSVSYLPSWGGNSGGYSLERVDPAGSSTQQSNWGTSTSILRSTPGVRNSITMKDRDLRVKNVDLNPTFPTSSDSLEVVVYTENVGFFDAAPISVSLFDDVNGDSVAQPVELLSTIIDTDTLRSRDSLSVFFLLTPRPTGVHQLIGRVDLVTDEDTLNNAKFLRFAVLPAPGAIRINEIMYAPVGGIPEWVEFINTSSDSVRLEGWKIGNRLNRYSLPNTILPPSGYLVIAKDSALMRQAYQSILGTFLQLTSLPTFLWNNNGDAVVFAHTSGLIQDSVTYSTTWGGSNGTSLERIDAAGFSQDSTNWGSSLDTLGATPGRGNSIVLLDDDLAIVTFPFFSFELDSVVEIPFTVLNKGRNASGSFSVEVYLDANEDSVATSEELLATVPFTQPIPWRDSLVSFYQWSAPTSGDHSFILRLQYATDGRISNNTSWARVRVGYQTGVVVINEIMYAPVGGIPEWIELINSSADSVRLEGWKIGNRLNRYSLPTTLIAPSEYVVITRDSALMRQAYQNISGGLIQLTSLPTFLWNNNGDAVVLAQTSGLVQDSVTYLTAWGGSNGASLERIDAFGFSQDSTNWGSSLDSLGATPGRRNSVVLLDDDLAITTMSPLSFQVNSVVEIPFTIQNKGKNTVTAFSVEVYLDANEDSLGTLEEFLATLPFTSIQPIPRQDSLVGWYQWNSPSSGDHGFIFRVQYAADGRISNNSSWMKVRVGYPKGSVLINEIMYDPLAGQAEYIELFNSTGTAISLTGWSLTDLPTPSGSHNTYKLQGRNISISAGSYFTIASDSSLMNLFPTIPDSALYVVGGGSLSLNNEGDAGVIRDILGSAIDSVLYSTSWHNPGVSDVKGRSLERINPSLPANDGRNWSTCASPIGGTPGMKNSIFSSIRPSNARLEFQPNPFSPDGDGTDDFTIIHYELPLQVSVISVKIYDVRGRLIRRLATNEPAGAQGQLVWDGKHDDGQKASIGMYIVLLEAIDEQGGVLEQLKGVVVLAAQLR
ncbi:MAG TPA: lamin tail domain-containing protein, partial [Bacteroidota bacterium]